MIHAKEATWRYHPTIQGIRVSRDGRIQREHRHNGRFTGAWSDAAQNRYGTTLKYFSVCVYWPRLGKPNWINVPVHRLVLETYVGPRPDGMFGCHNNGNPEDNRLSNLRYDTPRGNSADSLAHGAHPIGSRHGMSKLNEKAVLEIVGLLTLGMRVSDIAERFGVSYPSVIYIRDGKTWSHVTGIRGERPG